VVQAGVLYVLYVHFMGFVHLMNLSCTRLLLKALTKFKAFVRQGPYPIRQLNCAHYKDFLNGIQLKVLPAIPLVTWH